MKPTILFIIASSAAVRGIEWRTVPAPLSSGLINNNTAQPLTHFAGALQVADATGVRVVVSAAKLGRGKIRFSGIKDNQIQTLNAQQLKVWNSSSAMFNGTSIRVELIVEPGDSASLEITHLLAGFTISGAEDCCPARRGPRTLCGPDDRVASTDNRVGRINGNCTAWLVSNGAVLTAGHCNIPAGAVFEVNIPASAANGTTTLAAVRDQFPVLAGSITSVNSGNGNDYAVCRLGPNSPPPGLPQVLAHDIFGFFRMTPDIPAANAAIRVTGCGIDNSPVGSQPTVCGNMDSAGNCTHLGLNAQNQTLQTSTGGFAARAGTSLTYAVDTEPANSGSPIIVEATGFTIGIHTAGGCSSTAGSANLGTAFSLPALERAIANSPDPENNGNTRDRVRYLDLVKSPNNQEDGSVFRPHDTLTEAVDAVPQGGLLSITRGTYAGASNRGTLTKPMTIVAPVGPVTFGN